MCMEALQLAGRIIMECGGETYRVEETVTRMGRALGLREVESFAVPSGVFVSFLKADGTHETAVMRVHRGGTDLMRVDAVNAISRQLESGELDAAGALAALREVACAKPWLKPWMLSLAAAVSSGGWAVLFGGGWVDCIVSAVTAGICQFTGHLMTRLASNAMMVTLLSSFLAALLPMLLYHFTNVGLLEAAVAGALMPLLPGLAMTNGVQDALRGDMVSGVAHGIQALLTAALIAVGVLVATGLFRLLTGGVL